MPNSNITEALKEAYALAPSDIVVIETLEFVHALFSTIRICNDGQDHIFTLEDLSTPLFVAAPFAFKLPTSDDTGIKELQLTIDNLDERISDIIDTVKQSIIPIVVKYRVYLSSDATTPQTDPPIQLEVREISLSGPSAIVRAVFVDLTNKKFLTELYTRDRFPTLGA